MDLDSLEASVQGFYRSSIANSTNRTYTSAKKRFYSFCMRNNFPLLPASETALCLYVSYLTKEGLHYQSICTYLAAVRHIYIYITGPSWSLHRESIPTTAICLKENPQARRSIAIQSWISTILVILRDFFRTLHALGSMLSWIFCISEGRRIYSYSQSGCRNGSKARRYYTGQQKVTILHPSVPQN